MSSVEQDYYAASKTLVMQDACYYMLEEAKSAIAADPEDEQLAQHYGTIIDFIRDGKYEEAIKEWDDDYDISKQTLCLQASAFVFPDSPTSTPVATSAAVINDHTCTQCNNTSCSKTEKSCWRCGHPIS